MLERIEHTIELLSPMSHGGFGDTGNAQIFRRIPIITNGQRHDVPALSSGALRGVVRRLLWRETFEVCELSAANVSGWDRLYAALANGGTIEAAEQRVDPAETRRRRAELPILSLLGSALYSSHMAGRARVSNSWLVCRESTGIDTDPSCWDLLSEETRCRHVDAEQQNPEVSGVGPMPTTTETIIAGSVLSGHAHITGDLERSAWAHGLDLVTHLGGKAGQGFGEVRIFDHSVDASLYREWLRDHADEVRAALLRLAEDLGSRRAKSPKVAAKKPATTAPEQPGLF